MTKELTRDEWITKISEDIKNDAVIYHCFRCFKILHTMKDMYIPLDGAGLFCKECYELEKIEEISAMRNHFRKVKDECFKDGDAEILIDIIMDYEAMDNDRVTDPDEIESLADKLDMLKRWNEFAQKQEYDNDCKHEFRQLYNLIDEALATDGSHHKQWYLLEIAKELGISIDPDEYDEGIPP